MVDRHLIECLIVVGGDWGGYCLNGRAPKFDDDGITNVMLIDYVRVYSVDTSKTDTFSPTPAPVLCTQRQVLHLPIRTYIHSTASVQ